MSAERIYLQDDGDPDEVTWCVDQIEDTDTEYVRADIHAAALARVARLEAAAGLAKRAMMQIEREYVCPACAATIMDHDDHARGCTWVAALDALRAALEVEK